MKIKVSYQLGGELHFLRNVESASIEKARSDFKFSYLDDNLPTKLPSKANLVFQYQELLDAQKLTCKKRNNHYKRMLLFMKNCPNFKISKLPYYCGGQFLELYQSELRENCIIVNVETSKTRFYGANAFQLELKRN